MPFAVHAEKTQIIDADATQLLRAGFTCPDEAPACLADDETLRLARPATTPGDQGWLGDLAATAALLRARVEDGSASAVDCALAGARIVVLLGRRAALTRAHRARLVAAAKDLDVAALRCRALDLDDAARTGRRASGVRMRALDDARGSIAHALADVVRRVAA